MSLSLLNTYETVAANNVKVWLVNTGLSGGVYGVGKRMSLPHTRALVTYAVEGPLDHVDYENHEVFGVAIPKECPGVPSEVLNPKNTWKDKNAYDATANKLAKAFHQNFEKYHYFLLSYSSWFFGGINK